MEKWHYKCIELLHPLLMLFIICTSSVDHANIKKYCISHLCTSLGNWNKPNLKKKWKTLFPKDINLLIFLTFGRGREEHHTISGNHDALTFQQPWNARKSFFQHIMWDEKITDLRVLPQLHNLNYLLKQLMQLLTPILPADAQNAVCLEGVSHYMKAMFTVVKCLVHITQ